MQPDPMGIRAANLTNPQSLNRYAYVTNDPINKVDPLGLFEEEEFDYEEDYFDGGGDGGGGGGWFCSGCNGTPGEGDIKWFDSYGDVPDGYVEYGGTTAVGHQTGLDYILGPDGEIKLDILPLNPDNTINIDSSEQELNDFAKGVVNQLEHRLAGAWPLEKMAEIELMLFGGPFVEEAVLTDFTIEGAGVAAEEATASSLIYRGATQGNPNHVALREGEDAVSFRDSISNALPEPGNPPQPVLRPGRNYIGVDTSQLPTGSVVYDGGTIVNGKLMPYGHVSVTASPEQIVNATVTGGKFPK